MADLPSVLFVASECAPFVKAGGLGDVVGALPIALRRRGHDVRVVIPRYDTIPLNGLVKHAAPMAVPLGAGEVWCAVYETRLPGSDVPVYLLDHKEFFGRGYLYDPPGGFTGDNLSRYGFLSRGAFQLCKHLGWHPDVLHAHDWPTALVPIHLNTTESRGPLSRSASVLTIHNQAHQGFFPKEDLWLTHVPGEYLANGDLAHRGAGCLLKGGLYHATMLTTVSPRYAQEICTVDGGAGLESATRFRAADLVGILNGIDDVVWNPASDPHLPATFSADELQGKAECKRRLQREMHLAERPDVPLIGVVSRLGEQKGIDVFMGALGAILGMDAQVVVLGSGERQMEDFLGRWSHHGGDRFRAWIGFSEPLAHRIEAGADFFLMPSRFEPCGLNQMYSQRYGTLPIVRATGGLDDTVENCDERRGLGTGFKFQDLYPEALAETVRWALRVYRSNRDHLNFMQQRAMRQDFSWRRAADRYADVYQWALARRRGA